MGTEVSMSGVYTLLELAKRTNQGELITIAEVLNETNEILQDAVWIEANQLLNHVGTKRTYLPTGTFRQANQGVSVETSLTKQITEPIARLEAISDIDEAIIDIAPNKQETRSQEDRAFVEGLGQTLCETLLYGNVSTDAEKFNGLATRYDALSDSNVLGASGTGDDTTSLWIVEWGPTKVHMVYPKGSKAGLEMNDKGKVRTNPSSTTVMYAYETQFIQWCGLFVHDDRCVQRIANIETSGSSNTLNDDQIIEALNLLPTAGGSGAARIYVNRTLKTQLDILAKDKNNVNYTSDNAFGVPVTRFRGVPVRLVEQIVNTESAIS